MVSIVEDAVPEDEAASPEAPDGQSAPSKKRMKMSDFLPMTAVSLAVFATILSAVGLAVASRTVAEARIAIEKMQPAQHIAAERAARTAPLIAEPADHSLATKTSADDAPATAAELRSALADLRADLARYQNSSAVALTVRNGQSDLANRLGELTVKVDRIERSLNTSRAAKSEAGRARPS